MRRFSHSLLTIATFTLTASLARAGATDSNTSTGSVDLSWATRKGITGPASEKLGGSLLAVQFSADLDPVADPTKPLLSVTMKRAVLQAMWPDNKTIELSPVESTAQDGQLQVIHTLSPHVKLFIDAFGFKYDYDYNAQALLGKLPGSTFNYQGVADGLFLPWALTNSCTVKVTPPPLSDAALVSTPLEDIFGGGNNPILTGTIAFNATTAPTFTYTTTEITLAGGQPITTSTKHWTIPTTDADALDVSTLVKGTITYAGKLVGRPTVTISKIGSFTIPPITFQLDALGVELPYSSDTNGNTPIAVEFPVQTVHLPLPNVKAPTSLDVGSANLGERTSKKTAIKNTGELQAIVSLKSSDPQFKVKTSDKVMKPKDAFELEVEFTPTAEGVQSAEITVASNDPNEPLQVIRVTGNGVKIEEPPPPEPEPVAVPEAPAATESGCGCRTAPAPTSFAGFGLVGLALAALARRRRAWRT